MTLFSQAELNAIADKPLSIDLKHLQPGLQETFEEDRKNAISRLLLAVAGHPVATQLRAGPGLRNVDVELALLYARLRSRELDLTPFATLVVIVVSDGQDVDLWQEILNVLRKTRSTPPLHPQPTHQDTPITHSSASQQGSEQTHKQLDARILEEVKYCVYYDVDGFNQKYFEETAWGDRATEVFQACMTEHTNGRWRDFPDHPEEGVSLRWLLGLQQNYFAQERGCYSTSYNRVFHGSDADRKLDLFLKKRSRGGVDEAYDWKDVRVIGELKSADEEKQRKLVVLQLASYAREVFASQPTRHFVHGFSLCNSGMRLWVFDRSGPYSSTKFDIHEEPERFIRTVVGYAMMSDIEHGLDSTIQQEEGKLWVETDIGQNVESKLLLLDQTPIAHQHAIVCRGTTCYLAKEADADEPQYVVKFSWRSDKREPEGKLLRLAGTRIVEGVAKLIAFKDHITSIELLRSSLGFDKPYHFRNASGGAPSIASQSLPRQAIDRSLSQPEDQGPADRLSTRKRKASGALQRIPTRSRSAGQLSMHEGRPDAERRNSNDGLRDNLQVVNGTRASVIEQSAEETYDNRILCCLVNSPPGRPLRKFRSVQELLEVFRDAIRGHQSLYERGGILHRDISLNNIIISEGPGKGMLIDLDLAKELGKGPSGARHRTGTMEFMAIGVLDGVSHTYRHDLESFFYVFLWVCIFYGRKSIGNLKRRFSSLLNGWYQGDYRGIVQAKFTQMSKERFQGVLAEFPPGFEPAMSAAEQLRDILFPIRKGAMFTGTFEYHGPVYRSIIETFDRAAKECPEGGLE